MRCPFCKKDEDRVIDTRPSEGGHVIRRRRECMACSRRYTTHERLEDLPLRVIKKDGQRVPFDRKKVLAGIERALQKRPFGPQDYEALADAVESEVLESTEREIPSQDIGAIVMRRLRDIDEVAYVRFASVYRDFKAVDEFVQEVETMSGLEGGRRRKSGRTRRR